MPKPGAIRQMDYEQQKKEEDKEAFLQKQLYQKRKQREILKATKDKYEALKLKERIRKKEAVTEATSTTPAKSISPSES